ncbi:CMGC/SRPK protein kinase [Ephemerocybe angulata]|uniref:non-specific serine/threonine protein kinase n=1 Tax=Ephemerocybe angulata TaxID=980116 RepID=A0A8H6H778_9AGAR|nr:CMGC/SRPK protein kinase [Tulosesus angulatus]
MASFPEEPLNLSAADGFGYFSADINQTLQEGKYTIVRKLGWGPRSSTWLVEWEGGERAYWAVQIFTVSASKSAGTSLLPILQGPVYGITDSFPAIQDSFWVPSVHGEHLCLVMAHYGSPLSALLRHATSNGRAGLPIHTVQFTVLAVLRALEQLHKVNVMHSGVKLENLAFGSSTNEDEIVNLLSERRSEKAEIIGGFPAVRSQPLGNYMAEWDDPMHDIVHWFLQLAGFGHVQVPPYTPESEYNYSSAPETLLGNPTCGLSTDVWMLGSLAFELTTGKKLFTSTGPAFERLGEIRDVLHDNIPDTWRADPNVQALPDTDTSVQSLEESLRQVLTEYEAAAMSVFLRKCLVIDPAARQSIRGLRDDDWVNAAAKCTCCYWRSRVYVYACV